MRNVNFYNKLIQVIEGLYSDATSAVYLNNKLGSFFKTTVGVRQGCLLSPVMSTYIWKAPCWRRYTTSPPPFQLEDGPICNFRFANDFDIMGSSEAELQDFTTRLEKALECYGMEVSSEKSKIIVNKLQSNGSNKLQSNGSNKHHAKRKKARRSR